jgi:hypothetical protein
MKYYEMIVSPEEDGSITPGLNGVNVIDKDTFFDNDRCGPNRFYDKNYVFDYLIPMQYGDGNEDLECDAIYDFHSWLGESPLGGWLKPISARFKSLLRSFNLGNHKFYPAKVLFNGAKHEYFILQLLYDDHHDYIDFEKTLFNNRDSGGDLEDRQLEIRRFNSLLEVEEFADQNWESLVNWNYEKIVVSPKFRDIDLITFYKLGDLVSERLRDAIISKGLTGIRFQELPIPIEFSDAV